MKVAWVFPGQDAFQPLTGCSWAAADPGVAALLDRVGDAVGFSLTAPRERRRQKRFDTSVVQPLLTALCLGIAARLRRSGLAPDVVAGASLGELPAWGVATGADPEHIIDVAIARGAAMAEAARAAPGGMVAVAGDTPAAALAAGRAAGVCDVAAHNPPDTWVISGESAALLAIRAALPARSVPVSGPWHSLLMAAAEAPLRAALAAAPARPLAVPMRLNDAGRAAADDADIRAHLTRQLTHPVDWSETLSALRALGVTDVVTVGPGRVLRAQLRQAPAPRVRVHETEDPERLAALEALRS